MPVVSVPSDIWGSFQSDQLAQRSQAMLDGLKQKFTDAMTPPSAPSATTLAPSTGLPSLDALMSPFAPAARSLGASAVSGQSPDDSSPPPDGSSPPYTPTMSSPATSGLPSFQSLPALGSMVQAALPSAPSAAPSTAPSRQPALTTGPPPAAGDWAARARAAAVAAGHPNPDEFVEQMRQESQFDPDVISGKRSSPAGAQGIAQIMPAVAAAAGVNPLDPDAALRYAAQRMANNYKTYGGDSEKALADYNMGAGNLQKYGPRGLPETNTYIDRIHAATARQPALTTGPTPTTDVGTGTGPAAAQPSAASAYAPGSYTPNQISAATSEGLDYETALAVCGPAAAIAFARKTGRNPTMQEAVGLARQVGWTSAQGMAGPASEQKLLGSMGVASRLVDGVPDWGAVAADVQNGNPVIISTPGHYFVAEQYDPTTGKFNFGNSTAILKAAHGQTWFTPQEMASLGMGAPRGSLFMDSPTTPAPSVVAGGSRSGSSQETPRQPRRRSPTSSRWCRRAARTPGQERQRRERRSRSGILTGRSPPSARSR